MSDSLNIEDLSLEEAEIVAAGEVTGQDVIVIVGVIGVLIVIV